MIYRKDTVYPKFIYTQMQNFPVHLRGSKIIDFYQRIYGLGTLFVTYILHFF